MLTVTDMDEVRKENFRVRKVVSGYCPSDKTEKYSYQCPVVMRYLENKLKGRSIGDFFEKISAKKIVLYGVTEFAGYVMMDLESYKSEAIEIMFVCDRNPAAYPSGFRGIRVLGIDEMIEEYQKDCIDKILICNLFHSDSIFADLMKRGIRQEDLIPIVGAVFDE